MLTCVRKDDTLSTWIRRQMRSDAYAALSCYVDKSAAKHYAKTNMPWLNAPKTLSSYDNETVGQLRWADVPSSYAFKSTHGANLVMLVTNGFVYKGNAGRVYKNKVLTGKKLVKIGTLFLRMCKQCKYEVQYRNVHRQVLVEEFLGVGLQATYKVHVMGGDVVGLDVVYFTASNVTTGHVRRKVTRILNEEDVLLTAQIAHQWCAALVNQSSVAAMERLFQAARMLASGFRYLRADFYLLNGSWYFGELTLSPQAADGRMDRWFRKPFLAKIGYCANTDAPSSV